MHRACCVNLQVERICHSAAAAAAAAKFQFTSVPRQRLPLQKYNMLQLGSSMFTCETQLGAYSCNVRGLRFCSSSIIYSCNVRGLWFCSSSNITVSTALGPIMAQSRTSISCSLLQQTTRSHVTSHTSHVTRHTSHVTRHTSHVTPCKATHLHRWARLHTL